MGSPNTTAALLGPPAQPSQGVALASPAHLVKFALDQVGPPSQLYIAVADRIRVDAYCIARAQTFTIDYQILKANGEIVVGEENFTSVLLPATLIRLLALPEGYLLRIGVTIPVQPYMRGEMWISLSIARPSQFPIVIVAGYVSGSQRLAWPLTGTDIQTAAQGRLGLHNIANPAAGADISYLTQLGVRTRVSALSATLTTSAAVANRLVTLVADDQVATPPVAGFAGTVQAASLAITYVFGSGLPNVGATVGGFQTVPIPGNFAAGPAGRIRTITQNIQAADQWSAINLYSEEWIDF